jgi:hypothetical protein
VREWPRPSPRAMGRRQDAGATLQPVRHSAPVWCRRQGRSTAAPLRPRTIRDSPYLSPLATRHSLLAVFHHSPFAIRDSPSFSARCSPLAARGSLLAVLHHPPFAIRHSPLCPARPGRWVSRNRESRVKRRGSRISGEGPASAQGSGEVGLFENRRNSSERRANGAGLLVAKPARQLRLWILGFPGVAVASAPGASRRFSLDQ